MMASFLSTVAMAAALLCLAAADSSSSAADSCRQQLTELDPHMAQYVGQTFTVIGQHTDKTYKYEVGVCTTVNSSHPECAVLQLDEIGNDNPVYHCIGKISQTQVARSSDGVWIELTYTGGDTYNSHCQKSARTTRVVFLCDEDVRGQGHLDFLEENNEDNLCYYLFTLTSRAVCGYSTPAGDIIAIAMACLIGVWLIAMIIGVIYKRLIMGAKGWEQIPLLDLYREFGNLEADGCDLVCRTRQYTPAEYKEPSFGADTDSEEEKDDNLLPM